GWFGGCRPWPDPCSALDPGALCSGGAASPGLSGSLASVRASRTVAARRGRPGPPGPCEPPCLINPPSGYSACEWFRVPLARLDCRASARKRIMTERTSRAGRRGIVGSLPLVVVAIWACGGSSAQLDPGDGGPGQFGTGDDSSTGSTSSSSGLSSSPQSAAPSLCCSGSNCAASGGPIGSTCGMATAAAMCTPGITILPA